MEINMIQSIRNFPHDAYMSMPSLRLDTPTNVLKK